MDLEVGVRLCSVENRLRWGAVHVRAFSHVGTCLGRIEVGLTFLKVFDLTSCVFGSCEAAVNASYLCALLEVSIEQPDDMR